MSSRQQLAEARLYGILDLAYVESSRAVSMAKKMLAGGVQVLQLRAKNASAEEIVSLGQLLSPLCRSSGVPFILNDHPALAAQAGAEGVHVGQDDVSVEEARRLAGAGAIVGKSTHSLDQARLASGEGADYIGFGPLFATPTKPDYQPIGMRDIAEVHELVSLPIFCIGGIKKEGLAGVLRAGARRVVIVSGILQAGDVTAYCRECRDVLAGAGKTS